MNLTHTTCHSASTPSYSDENCKLLANQQTTEGGLILEGMFGPSVQRVARGASCRHGVTQDSIIVFQNFLILISVNISIKIHHFVCIKLAQIKFGCYLTFKFTFEPLKPENCASLNQTARFDGLSNPILFLFLLLLHKFLEGNSCVSL